MLLHEGKHKSVLTTRRYGPEIVIAALTHYLTIGRRPGLVLVAGQCGALEPLQVGDILIASTVFFFERRIASFGELSAKQGT